MDETTFLTQLLLHIRAKYPLFFVETADEDWIVDAVNREFGASCDVVVMDTLDDTKLDYTGVRQAIYLWCGACNEDWNAHRKALLKLARRFRTSVTLVMLGESWASLPDGTCMPPVLHAPLPSEQARQTVAQLALGAYAKDAKRLERIAFASAGMTRAQIFRALSKAVAQRRLDANFDAWEATIVAEKKALMARSSTLEIIEDAATMNDVGGANELKIWLKQRSAAFSDEARKYGLESPRGLLLVGVQGCGKSLLAKAVASDWHFPLLRLDMSSIFAGVSSNPDAALANALDAADAMAPAIIWCDEIEKIFNDAADPTTKRLLSHILNWLQERRSKTFFVATANDVQALPPELMRKGRFDEIFFVDLPDEQARKDIFQIHLRRRKRDPKCFDCQKLAEEARNFSGAEIEQAVMAALFAAFNQAREVTTEDILDAIQDTTPLFKQREDDIKRLREWAGERTRGADQNARILSFFK